MSGRGKPHNLTEAEIARLVDAYREGVTTKLLGTRFGISASTVSVILRKAGVLTTTSAK